MVWLFTVGSYNILCLDTEQQQAHLYNKHHNNMHERLVPDRRTSNRERSSLSIRSSSCLGTSLTGLQLMASISDRCQRSL